MTRPHKCRWIGAEPDVTAFKPCGLPGRLLEPVELGLDELEAIRLADLEGLYHDAAAERMGVSRATFGRLIASARHKVASALLGPKMLIFQGGKIMMRGQRTFACADCGASFQAARGTGRPTECPSCHGTNFHRTPEAGCGRNQRPGGGRGHCHRRRHGAAWAESTTVVATSSKENA